MTNTDQYTTTIAKYDITDGGLSAARKGKKPGIWGSGYVEIANNAKLAHLLISNSSEHNFFSVKFEAVHVKKINNESNYCHWIQKRERVLLWEECQRCMQQRLGLFSILTLYWFSH